MEGERSFVSAVVLAAGRGLRMGARAKQLLLVDRRPLIVHVVEHALASTVDEIVVVLGHEAAAVRGVLGACRASVDGETMRGARTRGTAIRFVVNPDYASGMASSLRAGLGGVDSRAAAALVLLGDQPDVMAADIDAVVGAYRAAGGVAIRALYTGTRPATAGHPVLLDSRLWAEVCAVQGDQGAREVLSRHRAEVRSIEIAKVAPGDIDTPQDLRRTV